MRTFLNCVPFGLVLAIGLSACASSTENVDNLYVQRLNARLAQYNKSAAEIDSEMKAKLTPRTATVPAIASAPSPAPDPNLPTEIMRSAEFHARSNMLNRFMHEAAASGQFGFMWSWLQTRAQELQRLTTDTDGKAATFQKDVSSGRKDDQFGARLYHLLVERGSERGALEELVAISNDLKGYQHDYQQAAAQDIEARQEALAFLGALAAADAASKAQPQMYWQMPFGPNQSLLMPMN